MRTTIEAFSTYPGGLEGMVKRIREFQEAGGWEIRSLEMMEHNGNRKALVIFEQPMSDVEFELFRLQLLQRGV